MPFLKCGCQLGPGRLRFIVFMTWLTMQCAGVRAAPPTTTGLYPAGGQRGTTVEVTAIGSFDTWPVKVWTSSAQLTILPGKDKGKLSIKIAPETPPGIYWLRCHDAQGAGPQRPFVVGHLPERMETEPNDDLRKAESITGPVVINGKLNRNGDVDGYAVTLKKGQTLVASILSHQVLRSASDMVMQLVAPNGTVLSQNHDYHGLDPQLSHTVTQDGPVIVRVFSFPANPDSSIRYSGGELYIYRLTLTTASFAELALPLAVDAKKPQPLRLLGWNLDAATSQGVLLREKEQGKVYHPSVAGLVPVHLEPWPTFDATLAGPKASSFTAPCCITAQLTGQQPYYETRITFTKGTKMLVQVLSQSLDLDLDPVLSIRDSSGKQVLSAEAKGLNSDLFSQFAAAQDGEYTVRVQDLHGRANRRMSFLLRVVPERPGYVLSIDTDRFILTPGKPLDIPVKVAAEGGFKEEIQLSTEGLPAGVQSKVLSTSADKKTITLRLEGKESLSTGFRIVGTVKGQSLEKRYVNAAQADLGTTTTDLWLTVLKK